MATFDPERLVLARERRGLLSRELASRCDVSSQTVSNWETGRTDPGEMVRRLAEVLEFQEDFFFRPPLDRLPEGAPSFRARTKIAARQKRIALASGDLVQELVAWLEERFELPEPRLLDLEGVKPGLAADVVRQEWLLGAKPIPNMIHLLESRGVLVFSLAQDCLELDAFSFWAGRRPVVLLNTMKSAERSRFDAAHELYHLLAHPEETGKQEEKDADTFAGAFLMPEFDLLKRIPRAAGLMDLIRAKKRPGVSLAALVYRLNEIGVITPWQYRTLFRELSRRGFRKKEPNPMEREGSLLLAKIFESLRAQGIRLRSVAAELGWTRDYLQEYLFGLGATMLSIDGSGTGAKADRSHLRLV